jgi:hypothetical protein
LVSPSDNDRRSQRSAVDGRAVSWHVLDNTTDKEALLVQQHLEGLYVNTANEACLKPASLTTFNVALLIEYRGKRQGGPAAVVAPIQRHNCETDAEDIRRVDPCSEAVFGGKCRC